MGVRFTAMVAASFLAGALAFGSAGTASAIPGSCPGDVNGDEIVDLSDLQAAIDAFGTTGTQAGRPT